MKITLQIEQDLTTNIPHIRITNGLSGYCISKPKISPIKKVLRKIILSDEDALKIREYLNKAFPNDK